MKLAEGHVFQEKNLVSHVFLNPERRETKHTAFSFKGCSTLTPKIAGSGWNPMLLKEREVMQPSCSSDSKTIPYCSI